MKITIESQLTDLGGHYITENVFMLIEWSAKMLKAVNPEVLEKSLLTTDCLQIGNHSTCLITIEK